MLRVRCCLAIKGEVNIAQQRQGEILVFCRNTYISFGFAMEAL